MLRYWREILLGLIAFSTLMAVMSVAPIPQDTAYHQFADTRIIWGIPNCLNVVTNFLFLVIGLLGCIFCMTHRQAHSPWSWTVFFVGVMLVAFGSAYYHWSPTNETLAWDRLAIAIAFMGLFVALLSEYISTKLERLLLIPMSLFGVFSVVYWHFVDDLRIYVWVQFFPLLCILITVFLFKGRYTHQAYLITAVGFYVLAKISEVFDKTIFSITKQHFSGHALKHILASFGVFFIYLMLKRRSIKEQAVVMTEAPIS